MKKITALLLTGIMILSLTGCGSKPDTGSDATSAAGDAASFTPVVWKFGNQHNSEQLATIVDKEIVEEINKATEGRVTIKLYTDSSLGDYTSVFDELMLGTVQMAHITGVDTYDGRLNAAMLPYLITNYDDCNKAYREDGYIFSQVSEVLTALDIRLMGFFPEDFVGIGSQIELTNPTTVGAEKGAIVRVPMLDVFALSTKDLGFRVSSIAYSDAYAALQTGVVNGMDGNGALATYAAFRDVTKYFYDYRHLCEATMIMISKTAWEALLPQDQEAISKIISTKCQQTAALAEKSEEEYKEKMRADGMEVIEFTDEEYAAFAESCHKNVWPQLAKNYPEGFLDNVLADLKD